MSIGGIDNNIIKTNGKEQTPFIPGSSLKGKLRSMLAKMEGSMNVKDDTDRIKDIFGHSGDNKDDGEETKNTTTRLLVRDAGIDKEHFIDNFPTLAKDPDNIKFTEVKTENVIDRKTGSAEHPRQIERVPAGAIFKFEMIYDVYDDEKMNEHLNLLQTAINLLEFDYLGGSGSRGYGKIKFKGVNADYFKIENDKFNKEADTEKSIKDFLNAQI